MERIHRKLLVLSGKGGVGKSTVAVNLAIALAAADRSVGLLDVDVHGPSVPKLMGLEGRHVMSDDGHLVPVMTTHGIKVMSIGFLLPGDDQAVIWRGPRKHMLIRQFLQQSVWGELDYLVIDAPPGTGDEPLAVAELVRPGVSAVLVTTPQDLALADVRRSVQFCRQVDLPIEGVLENMSGLECPACGHRIDLFKSGGGETLAASVGVRFLGRIPLEPEIVVRGDQGRPFGSEADAIPSTAAFASVVDTILSTHGSSPAPREHRVTAPGSAT
jgi:Mrp family chromosome partitioning ATPase